MLLISRLDWIVDLWGLSDAAPLRSQASSHDHFRKVVGVWILV